MKRIKYIIQGFYNLLSNLFKVKPDNSDILKLGKQRLEICNKCEYHTENLGRCKICGCYCRAKVLVDYYLDEDGKSIDGCPMKKW